MNKTDFTGLYPISKTLRFELKPIGKTIENIQKSRLLQSDELLADQYVKVKKLIDRYHKAYIEKKLSQFTFKVESENKLDSLSEYVQYYAKADKTDKDRNHYETIKANLRKQLAAFLKDDETYKRMLGEKLIEEDLPAFLTDPDEIRLVGRFNDFTTYFTGFNTNRKNMYSEKDQQTGIAHRVVNDNLNKFLQNIKLFNQLAEKPDFACSIQQVEADFKNDLLVEKLADMFTVAYFNQTLSQKQIEVYNLVLGGKSGGNTKIKGLNEYLNEFNQQQSKQNKQRFEPLLKQILSDRESFSWLPEKFTNDQEVLQSIQNYGQLFREKVLRDNGLKSLLETMGYKKLDGIYVSNGEALSGLSNRWLKNWNIIRNAIIADLKVSYPLKRRESEDKYESRLKDVFDKTESFTIAYINHCLQKEIEVGLESYFQHLDQTNADGNNQGNLFERIDKAFRAVDALWLVPYPADSNLKNDNETVELLKNLLDAIKQLQYFIKPLLGNGDEVNRDMDFYGEFNAYWDVIDQLTPLYNKVRDYVTQKPYSPEKIKLNFYKSTLLNGWDQNKEKANLGVILRKEGCYYLGIMDIKHNKLFNSIPVNTDGECYEKMIYKLLPGSKKHLPKGFGLASEVKEFNPDEEIRRIYNTDSFKKGATFQLDDCHRLIDFYKASLNKHPDWKQFGFHFSETNSYEDINGFYKEVDEQGYKLTFSRVPVDYINQMVDEGKLYLFQIYNKDFSEASKGKPNLHTLYWKMLFDDRNLADVVYKLNGQAEVFFRKKSLSYKKPTHPAGQPISKKNKNRLSQKSVFDYDLIKNRRYTVDKFLFHVSITLNFKSRGTNNINQLVNEYLKQTDRTHVIGIDRGERNLLYVVMLDRRGRIVKQFSLNTIQTAFHDTTFDTDYHELLDEREDNRQRARQSWKTIENIKELKEGYLSQAIHVITRLMVQYDAVVVLEDLNVGFKRGRQKVEKQVYQLFEKKLIEKLNYLVDKNLEIDLPGGVLKAYQLTNQFTSFKAMGMQNGFLFYVPAWNTSNMDPSTGFVNLFNLNITRLDDLRQFFNRFDRIRYNEQADWFEFEVDYNQFDVRMKGTRNRWTLCTHGERIRSKQRSCETVNLTDAFKELFRNKNIDIQGDLKSAIVAQHKQEFFTKLFDLFKLTLQLRNSNAATGEDYILSPVKREDGTFFRSSPDYPSLPVDADANGAYNIARKGLMILNQIKQADNLSKLKFDLSNKSWLDFAQQKPYLDE